MEVNPYLPPDRTEATVEEKPAQETLPPPFASPRWLGMCTCLCLGLNVAAAMFALFLQLGGHVLAESAGPPDLQMFMDRVDLFVWVNTTDVSLHLLRLLAAPFFIAWTYRVHRNLLSLGYSNLDWKPVAGLIVWFIPFLGLVLPCLVIREIAWRSDPRAEELGSDNRLLIAVNWWWGLFVAGPVLFLLQLYVPDLLGALPNEVWFRLYVVMLVSIVFSGVLACWLVLRLNHLQEQRLRRLQADENPLAIESSSAN